MRRALDKGSMEGKRRGGRREIAGEGTNEAEDDGVRRVKQYT